MLAQWERKHLEHLDLPKYMRSFPKYGQLAAHVASVFIFLGGVLVLAQDKICLSRVETESGARKQPFKSESAPVREVK